MTVSVETRLSSEMFDALVTSPEYRERDIELIDGELVEKMVAGRSSSKVSITLMAFVTVFVKTNKLGETTDAQGGYHVGKDRYIPDGAFVRKERFPVQEVEGYATIAPDLAIEVISLSDRPSTIAKKVANYVRNGTTLWLVDPEEQSITVYFPNFDTITYTKDQILDGGEALRGFSIALSSIFAD